ncbi:hypothetical protein [Mycobacterium sp.]|uniref:hypothetical protein n=1 Tax=Mycobacterium sp. TaxID=1785 RepID=UPI002D8A647D|nr:hypothetical protein [Mycobacterium sp.]
MTVSGTRYLDDVVGPGCSLLIGRNAVSSARVLSHVTGEYHVQHRAGDASGPLEEARNV